MGYQQELVERQRSDFEFAVFERDGEVDKMTHKGTVTLETERLILRRFTMDDAEPMFRNWASDPEVTKYLTWPTHENLDISREVIRNWLSGYEAGNKYSWAIELKNLHEPIGSISVVKADDDTNLVHIGYCIGKTWWHQGYTSEALTRLVRFFFEEVNANRIEARFDPRNPNSGKVMAKAGLQYEGTMRQADRNNQGGICDASYYGILADDYFGKEQKEE
jgi:ribosomal-protein-alanine N-acetyltransferase